MEEIIIEKIKQKWTEPVAIICDICKKELENIYIWKSGERTLVTCRACKEKGIIPKLEVKEKFEITSDPSVQLKLEKKRFAEKLKRRTEKAEKLKDQFVRRAEGNHSLEIKQKPVRLVDL